MLYRGTVKDHAHVRKSALPDDKGDGVEEGRAESGLVVLELWECVVAAGEVSDPEAECSHQECASASPPCCWGWRR